MNEDKSYIGKVKEFMLKMIPGTNIKISDIVKKTTPEQFIDCVKIIIETEWDLIGWKFEFNSDYTILKRCDADNLITFEEWIKK